jgi:hypothetical protein
VSSAVCARKALAGFSDAATSSSDCVGKLDDLLVQRFDRLERLSKYTEIVLKRAHRRKRVRKPPHMIAKTLELFEPLECRSNKLEDRVGCLSDFSKVLLAAQRRLEELGNGLTERVHRLWLLNRNLPIPVVSNLFRKGFGLR